ncbi:phosphotransferase system, enzyme I, PtsI [Alkalispirochaeta americana]|uniref:Phosphoenolpyruvate-protein phosphotransferase n=1 Tax=Alkalispirochaeta americana TaxID=159291 RepID=A0A1N6R210_9SPIO|nr:phosphoenolpyruvate--protein phosphotransferase [Alkalispirochaeta americana]SIQ22817.1 phosphotransferase system, enzyme I, PtsI [Alkalispirochaeta americana]
MQLTGLVASPGIALGQAVLFAPPLTTPGNRDIGTPDQEMSRLRGALAASIGELERLQDRVKERLGSHFAHIFRSQQTIAEDEAMLAEVESLIRDRSFSAEGAVQLVFNQYIQLFAELDSEDHNRARSADLEDVARRIRRNLFGLPAADLSDLPQGSIIVARDLYPSDTAMLDTDRVVAIVTERGGVASHVAILAKSLKIPAAVGVSGAMAGIAFHDQVVLDGGDREIARVMVNPPRRMLQHVRSRKALQVAWRSRVEDYRGQETVTPDGEEVTLSVNLGSSQEIDSACTAGACSVGLYRSEFLFLGSSRIPSEETQFQAYRKAAKAFSRGFVIIRTLDVGGDKQVASIPAAREDNPFLGNRGIRLCLARPELFLPQLRAILRASAFGSVKLMLPLVGGVPELEEALEMIEVARQELVRERIPFDPGMEIGITVEVPSAVWMADALAQRVDFFSIGTNDLTQYLLAADRLNGDVSRYYRIYDPAVFLAIRQVVEAARRHRRWVGVCGELGGDPLAIPALIGLGVRELSMLPWQLAEATWLVRTTPLQEAALLADSVLASVSHGDIRALLDERYRLKSAELSSNPAIACERNGLCDQLHSRY